MRTHCHSCFSSEAIVSLSAKMEGLIPKLCEAIKRSNGRRRYRSLSSGAVAQPSCNQPDFYPDVFRGDNPYGYMTPQNHVKERNGGHGRFKSYAASPVTLGEHEGKSKGDDGLFVRQHRSSKLVRFRSQQQRTFSCMSGGFSQ